MKIVGLRTLHTDVTVHLQGLNDLGEDINQFAGTLGPALWKKLPEPLRRQWVATEANKITDLNGIMDMLKKAVESKERFVVLSGNEPKNKKPSPEKKPVYPVSTAATLAGTTVTGTMVSACLFCRSTNHNHFQCPLSVAEKKRVVQRKALCYNCLNAGHPREACRSPKRCKICRSAHHTTLHPDPPAWSEAARPAAASTSVTPPATAVAGSSNMAAGLGACSVLPDQATSPASPSSGSSSDDATTLTNAASTTTVLNDDDLSTELSSSVNLIAASSHGEEGAQPPSSVVPSSSSSVEGAQLCSTGTTDPPPYGGTSPPPTTSPATTVIAAAATVSGHISQNVVLMLTAKEEAPFYKDTFTTPRRFFPLKYPIIFIGEFHQAAKLNISDGRPA